jgi:hypothetical protein
LTYYNFPVHGAFKVSVRDRLLVINGEGPANVEMAQQYREVVAPYREKLAGQPWASLVILGGLPLFPPEARAFMLETVRHVTENTEIVATGVVFKDVEYENAIEHFWGEIYQKAKLPYFFSNEEQEVTDWLLQKIEEANSL